MKIRRGERRVGDGIREERKAVRRGTWGDERLGGEGMGEENEAILVVTFSVFVVRRII